MLRHRFAAVFAMFGFGASVALACGPDFPWQLLDDRSATLKAAPANSFRYEAAHFLAPAKDRLRAQEMPDFASADDIRAARDEAEQKGLSAAQRDHLHAARMGETGEDAFAAGEGLPQAIRLYAAGAADYRRSLWAQAGARFAAILALPDAERSSRAVWAAYMSGKVATALHDDDRAAAAFQKSRAFAAAGAPDPLGLAVASFGEEAKLHFDRATALLAGDPASSSKPGPADQGYPPQLADAFRTQIAKAVALYSTQAAHGSASAIQSLRIMAEFIFDNSGRLDAVIADPATQRLLTSFALSRSANSVIAVRNDLSFASLSEGQLTVLDHLIHAIETHGGAHPEGADRLAALSYARGRYDLAIKMAALSSSPLASWVKAKIEIQKGNLAAAAGYYAQASKGFPAAALEDAGKNSLIGESGVLSLARGEYVDALEKLYPVAREYWGDVAYIAERVLTRDELIAFVESHVKPPVPGIREESEFNPAAALRDLLARRLMREGRYDQAVSYFRNPNTGKQAKAYAAALAQSQRRWSDIGRAEGLFQAARMARQSGMEILGAEADPDYHYYDGNFAEGLGRGALTGAYITAAESARFADSTPAPHQRFHYRYIAVNEAVEAANLLPPRSQAFAAVLCHATAWSSQDPARATDLYHRYVAQGPHVAWAVHFGRQCPDPDFAGAVSLQRAQYYRAGHRYVSQNRWWFLSAGILALGLLAAGGYAGRRLLRKRAG